MRWIVHGERSLYESEWVNLRMVDVEIPGDRRFDHHVVRFPLPAAGTVVRDATRGVLLLWRHRFITDSWGWEIPAGKVEAGESVAHGAVREVEEETGWRPGPLRHLVSYHPNNGVTDQTFHIYLADGATHIGAPTDASESERIEWVPVADVRAHLAAGRIKDGLSLTALATAFALSEI
ncbi:MAG TPA: NUDIX hydrolase [Acidimicrobiales bacterium]|jgi:8-oxo-dGTP pyrophosphatase MutT (NUDIX family)|nr:NUDIX hydrolase [Acidimicrobiales bacterium]